VEEVEMGRKRGVVLLLLWRRRRCLLLRWLLVLEGV
jgi:hypothetical protein